MSEQNLTPASIVKHPVQFDVKALKAYWEGHGQFWRTEPEIDEERQAYLTELRTITPDIRKGIYPFKGVQLTRADIEWLLATHENGRGPVDWSDKSQRTRDGLDLRGVDLSNMNLQNLPLARTIGDVSWRQWFDLTENQHDMAVINLSNADMKGVHLEGASLEYAQLEGADIRYAYLEQINLAGAQMHRTYFANTHLEGAIFFEASLKDSYLWDAYLAGAGFRECYIDGVRFNRANLVDENFVGPFLVDVHWGNVNLGVIDWSQIKMLGDEYEAHQPMHDGKIKDAATRMNEYEEAVRANRQLAVVLQSQGLNEESAQFAYRAQLLQRVVFRRRRRWGQYFFSGFLDLLAGYGYRPIRSLFAYLLVIFFFATSYALLGTTVHPAISPLAALIFSITAFHGRGFFPGGIPLDHPLTIMAAMEAIIGLIIEISFIATFTQRFFGK